MKFTAKLITVAIAGLTCSNGQTFTNFDINLEQSCTLADKYDVNLFHSGFYSDANHLGLELLPLST